MLLRQLLHTAKMGGAAGSYGDMAVDALATGISQVPNWALAAGVYSVTVSPPMLHQVRVKGASLMFTVTAPA